MLDVFWRYLAEIRRLKLLSKTAKNENAPKNEVEDEKMLKNMVSDSEIKNDHQDPYMHKLSIQGPLQQGGP